MLGNLNLRLYGVMEYTGIQLLFLRLLASQYLQAIVGGGGKDAFPEGLILPWDLLAFVGMKLISGLGHSSILWRRDAVGTRPLFHGEDSWCRVRKRTGRGRCNIVSDLLAVVIWEEGEAALALLSSPLSGTEPLPLYFPCSIRMREAPSLPASSNCSVLQCNVRSRPCSRVSMGGHRTQPASCTLF